MQTLLAILSLIPLLIKVIMSVEEAFPIAGAGKEKLAMVKGMMEASYNGMSTLMPTVEKIISIIVETANNIGAFKK